MPLSDVVKAVARNGLPALLMLVAACAPEPGAADAPADPQGRRPNLVLIIIDTLRADMLSSYGHPADPSPALTRLAAGGVQFDSVLSQTSWTLPSIGSMLTSQYPRTLGLYNEDDQALPQRFETLAEVLHDHGYATFGATANPNINSRAQFDQGFDEYVDSIVIFGKEGDEVEPGEISFRDSKLHSAGGLLNQAHDFAAAQARETPVFLQLNLMEVHEHRDPAMLRPEYGEAFKGQEHATYLRSIRQVTDDIEAFAGRLRALPGWDDTLFCITSDHGEGLSDHPAVSHSKGHGALLYSSMVQVPWILFNAAWTPARSRVSQDVRLLELAPTLLDLVGIDPPSAGIAGRSLRPLIDGKALSVSMPDYIITETYFRNFRKISVHGPEWQYVHNRGSVQRLPEHELQSRAGRANGVLTDVAADHQDVVERMRRYLQAWESRHAEAPAVAADEVLSEDVLRQLEALGYTR